MKKSGSPTKSYMCNSDNPKMHSSNMGKAGKGYADGGMVPLPPNTRFIGTDKAPMPPVRPKPPAMSQPFGTRLDLPPVGYFSQMPPRSAVGGMQGAAPLTGSFAAGGMQVMPPKTGPRPDYNNRQMNVLPPVVRAPAPKTPIQKVNEYVERRGLKSKGI